MRRAKSSATTGSIILTFAVGGPLYFLSNYFVEVIIFLSLIIFVVIIALMRYYVIKRHRFEGYTLADIDQLEGEEFERVVAYLLSLHGFCGVKTTKRSGDYGTDIIARKGRKRYIFQCKRYAEKVGTRAVQEVSAAKGVYRSNVEVVITNNYFTENAYVLAKANDVLLWDRDKLVQLMGIKS